MEKITNEIVKKTKEFLGEDGLNFFKECVEKHGEISPVYMESIGYIKIPHPVHFREGMQVRNFLRSTGLCNDWTDHDYDDNWTEVVEKCLKEK